MNLRKTISIVAAVLICSVAHAAESNAVDAIKALRQGGYVVVLIPGDTDKEHLGVPPAPSLDNCSSQAALSDFGRMSASAFGRLLVREHIRVASLYSSRFCTGVETAERIAEPLRKSKIIRLDDLGEAGSPVTTVSAERRTEALRRLASSQPAKGANTLVVTHRPNVAEAFGADFANLTDGELAIFKPTTGKQYELAYRVKLVDLSAYLRASKTADKTAQSPKS